MSKELIAYFSVSGNTMIVAQRLAKTIDADIFRIEPQIPYTDRDVRWTNPLARCNREKIGKKDVPIKNRADISQYALIYIGFPIWYYGAPNIIETFLKENDFENKKIALFATSGGSDMGKTAQKLQPFLKEGSEITAACLFDPNADVKSLLNFAKEARENQ